MMLFHYRSVTKGARFVAAIIFCRAANHSTATMTGTSEAPSFQCGLQQDEQLSRALPLT
jgi:hypothetical protein